MIYVAKYLQKDIDIRMPAIFEWISLICSQNAIASVHDTWIFRHLNKYFRSMLFEVWSAHSAAISYRTLGASKLLISKLLFYKWWIMWLLSRDQAEFTEQITQLIIRCSLFCKFILEAILSIFFISLLCFPQNGRRFFLIEQFFAAICLHFILSRYRMSSNSAYEPDNGHDRPSAGPKNTTANSQNGRTPNENTSLNVHLDTYFADERIPIPERVS